MSILESVGAANGLLKGAADLVRELKRPRVSEGTFAEMLRQAAAASDPEAQARQTRAMATKRAGEVMRLRDVNGDGLLSRDESGLKADAFTAADGDGDGMLSAEEVRQVILQNAGVSE